MQIGFEARGTRGGNVTVRYDDTGKEVSVAPGSGGDTVDYLTAEAYRAAYPDGEVMARGTITVKVEMI